MLAQITHIVVNLLLLLSVIFIITIVHEFGHYCVAKLCGMKVLRFSIGFGKPLYKLIGPSGTEYVLAPILFGGYLRLLDTREVPVSPEMESLAFDRRPIWQRLLVSFAGSGFNLFFAFLAFWLVFIQGITYVKPVIGSVIPYSLAAKSGLHVSEEILSIDGRPTLHWAAVAMTLMRHYGETGMLSITVRDLQDLTYVVRSVNLNLNDWHLSGLRPQPLQSLGIVPLALSQNNTQTKTAREQNLLRTEQFPLSDAWLPAVQQECDFTTFNLVIIYKMLTGVISLQSLGGPISIFQATILAAGQGVIIYINFLGLLSISIAVINLLPIPGLDGAQIFYSLWELFTGKPVSMRVQILAFRLGMIALLLLMFQATINDLLRLS